MSRKVYRVRDLAVQANLDLDEALVTLWDAGLDRYERGEDIVRSGELRDVRRVFGLHDNGREMYVSYWLDVSRLDRSALAARLEEVGVRLQGDARRIPKNSLRRLRRLFDARPPIPERPAVQSEPALPPLIWKPIGHPCEACSLTFDEIAGIHAALESDFADSADPIRPPGIKSASMLESAAFRPLTGINGEQKYPTIEMACAALFHSLVHNHPFHNGNKRTALVSLLALLDRNGRVLTCDQQELFRFTLRTAQHRLVQQSSDQASDREVIAIASWVVSNSRALDRGERPMKWVRLKQRLSDFGCEMETLRGNRLNIIRTVRRQARFGIRRTERLQTQVSCAGDGTEAPKNTIHKIRKDLKLDDLHNVDSAEFYVGAQVDAFIIEYRRILQRLAKL